MYLHGTVHSESCCKHDSSSAAGVALWKNSDLCMFTLLATLPPRMKRTVNQSNKTLGLSVTDNGSSVKVKRTKMGRMFQAEGKSISALECRVVEQAKYCKYIGTLRIRLVVTGSSLV